MNKTVHIISHSHWDREWYMPFEYHRAYLVKLIDNCIELFEKDDKIYFVISLKADASPKSDSLRTKSVWFKFSLMENA